MFKPTRKGNLGPEYIRVSVPSMGLVWAKTDGKSVKVHGWGEQPSIELHDLPEETYKKLLELIEK